MGRLSLLEIIWALPEKVLALRTGIILAFLLWLVFSVIPALAPAVVFTWIFNGLSFLGLLVVALSLAFLTGIDYAIKERKEAEHKYPPFTN